MIRSITVFVLLIAFAAGAAFARPDARVGARPSALPHDEELRPADGPTPWLRASQLSDPAVAPAKSTVDTVWVLGGPDRWDGKFENADGTPNWHGWTHRDPAAAQENHWHVSDYWAYGLNGHGPENLALVCTDQDIPACAAPDTIGGVGTNWFDDIQWTRAVSDPGAPTTVRLTAWMHYDLTDIDWDFLELFIVRAGAEEMLGQWTGSGSNVFVDISTMLQAGEYAGDPGDEVRLIWRVWSDAGYSDLDCLSPSHGAAQIDDISIWFDDELIEFEDFQDGELGNWQLKDFSGVGDFAHLRGGLDDLDPCQQNTSVQVTFVDDGIVVPGAGPTYCEEYCYGPDGTVLNHSGGLLADDPNRDWFLRNEIYSPPLAWPAGLDGAQLEFDAYKHEEFSSTSPGIFFFWYVRSTDSADPADLEFAEWKSRNFVFYGNPDYDRFIEPVSDLIVSGAQWAQIMLGVDEMGWLWGIDGTNGTPAPYFDNVALKAWEHDGPEILVSAQYTFQDAFPTAGDLNPADLAANSCRVDAAVDVNYDDLVVTAGDSLLAEITPLREGAVLAGPGRMHWVMLCNPVFDGVRTVTPGPDGIARGSVFGEDAYDQNGYLREQYRAFDLPDEGFLFPGDRLRYYVTVGDDVDGDVRWASWPADTTAVLDFSAESTYPDFAEIRGLPVVTQPAPGEFGHARILLWDETGGAGRARDRWLRSLTELGFVEGVDYDHLRLRNTGTWSSLGIDASATPASLAGYGTILVGTNRTNGITFNGDGEAHADALLVGWLELGARKLLLSGDSVFSQLSGYPDSELVPWVGVVEDNFDISRINGGERDLRINAAAGNGVLPDGASWTVNGQCPAQRSIDAVTAGTGTVPLATLDPAGSIVGAHDAVMTRVDTLGNRIAMLPFDLSAVETDRDNPVLGAPNFSGRTLLLKYLLDWFMESGSGPYSNVPEATGISLRAAPNPFNPRTTIAFELPRTADVTLDIHDVQGRRIHRLVDGQVAAGPHERTWSGRDERGRAMPSGVYFYRFVADGQTRLGKLTLLK